MHGVFLGQAFVISASLLCEAASCRLRLASSAAERTKMSGSTEVVVGLWEDNMSEVGRLSVGIINVSLNTHKQMTWYDSIPSFLGTGLFVILASLLCEDMGAVRVGDRWPVCLATCRLLYRPTNCCLKKKSILGCCTTKRVRCMI